MLIVEDGTGLADANGYISVTDADAFFTARADAAWTGSSAAKEAAIIRATDYIEGRFGGRARGSRLTETQALAFPREEFDHPELGVISGVPAQVARACALFAKRALTVDLDPDPVRDASGRVVVAKTEKVGPITETTGYLQGASAAPEYPAADRLMRPFLIGGGARRVIR